MQLAFIPGISIADNILLAQDLIQVLNCMHSPLHIIKLIMACVTDAQFSVMVNGSFEGHFKGTGGLGQGRPLSPFLFAMVMEFFSIMMSKYDSSNLIPTHF